MIKLFKFLTVLSLLLCSATAYAEPPLLQEGKKTVFQRVVSHPGAELYSDQNATQTLSTPRTFTSFYVYARKNNMVKVGVSASKADGWLKQDSATDWPQAITMVFTDQMGRQPVLFFKDHDQLEKFCESESIKDTIEEYIELFNTPNAHIPDDCPVLATEPLEKEGEVAKKDFYLVPVLKVDPQYKEVGTQLLQVACIDPGVQKGKKAEKKPTKKSSSSKPVSGMKTGIVFVLDTTISMGPYIEQTKELTRSIFAHLKESKAKDNIAIGIVAFRSNVEKRPETEYNTKVICDLTTVESSEEFEELLNNLQEAKKPTHAFDEDSLAGVQEAVDSLSWDKVDGKAILLVTDAGPLPDSTAKTGMTPEGMRDYLRKNNIFLTAIHIKTAKGKFNHPYAEKSYRELSKMENGRSAYIPINVGKGQGASEFRRVAESAAKTFCQFAEMQYQKGQSPKKPSTSPSPKNASPEEQMKAVTEAIGYAMQLQFRGNKNETRAPQVHRAWIADADLPSIEANPDEAPIPVVYPAVLLTKVQLSQLRKQLNLIINTAEEAFLQDSEKFNFFEQLISAAAQMSRDPSSFNKDPKANLAQKGVLLEVLDGLPYQSEVLRLTQEDWTNKSTGEQKEFIKRLKGLVAEYDKYDQDNTHWEGFGSPNSNEWVYRVPLSILP